MNSLVASAWPTVRIKHIARLLTGGTPRVDDPANWSSDGAPWVTISDMTRASTITDTARRVTTAGVNAARLKSAPAGTILFSMYASLGQTAVLGVPAYWNQAIVGVVPLRSVESRFLSYALQAVRPHLEQLAKSNTQPNLSGEQVANLSVPMPERREQAKIADFLDRETARLDRLTESRSTLLRHLNERRRATILRGVCGVLRQADTHDVGLPWTDEVRRPWPRTKIKYVAKLGTGHTPSRSYLEYWEDCTIPWITTGEIQQVRDDRAEIITETREKVSEFGLANSAAALHPKGTVVLCRTASAGYSAIMGSDMATSQDFVTWTCSDRLRPRYLLMCLRAMRQDLLGRLAYGSTHKTIYFPDVEALPIPLPSVREQQEVLDQIDGLIQPIDELVDLVRKQLDLIREHRSALITATVNGQVHVPA